MFNREANMPRFGHGAFLLCLEHLYKKVTNKNLCYTALVGKPSEITYKYAEEVLQQEQAKLMFTRNASPNPPAIKSMYFVGDNVVNLTCSAYNRHWKSSSPFSSLGINGVCYMHSMLTLYNTLIITYFLKDIA